ncbi:MAG TPA: hypothetical protein VG291_18625, partial [Xanthobacteraceae bacterium]|nr:hypothetical protein [Xanthobacteraceae bacterium]
MAAMAFEKSAASRMRTWQSRPSLGRIGIRPVGPRPLLIFVLLGVAVAVNGFQRASHRFPAEVHGNIVGKAWVIDGDTVDIGRSRIRLQGID